MTEFYCPKCLDDWHGAYTCEHRCTTCMSILKAREPWRKSCETNPVRQADREAQG